AFENETTRAAFFHLSRVIQDFFFGFIRTALNFEAAHLMNKLGSQSKVSDNRNAGFDEMSDEMFVAGQSLEFDRVAAGLHQTLDGIHVFRQRFSIRKER